MHAFLRVPGPLGSRMYAFLRVPEPLWSRMCAFLRVPEPLGSRMYAFLRVPEPLGSWVAVPWAGFACIFTRFWLHGEQDVCIFTCAGASGEQDVCIFTCAGAPAELRSLTMIQGANLLTCQPVKHWFLLPGGGLPVY